MVEHKGRVTTPGPDADADLLAVFAEAEAKAHEHDGLRFVVDDGTERRTFDLWASRLTFAERRRIQKHTGFSVLDVQMAMASGEGPIEAMAAIVAMSMFQRSGKLPPMSGITAWLEQVLYSDAGEVDVEPVPFDPSDPEDDEGNGSGQD